jgi:hypothetical protein
MIIAKGHRRCIVRLVGQEVTGACESKAQSGALLRVGVRLCLFVRCFDNEKSCGKEEKISYIILEERVKP